MVDQRMIHSLLVIVLLTTIYATKTTNGLILEMIHGDSPKSPIYRANLTSNERMKMYIEMSSARIKSFRRSHVTSLSPNEGLIRPKLSKQHFSYLVQVGIGTFINEFPTSRTYYLDMDTASDLTWTQCEGAVHSFNQVDPLFPASQSATYQVLDCTDCPPDSICEDSKCVIDKEYVEGSKVSAIVALEDFTFASEGETSHRIHDVMFGCGFDMQNFLEERIDHNMVSGIMGMSSGYYGFMEQTKLMFNGKFSYCLQQMFRPQSSPMYLRFGNDVIRQPGLQMQTTPFYNYDNVGSYYLHLQGMSVDTQRLSISPDIFQRKDDGTGGCVIDSGTATSWIITGAYQVLERSVNSFFKRHNGNWRKLTRPPTELNFDLCYQRYKLPRTIVFPTITFHFENNADFVIGTTEAFFRPILEGGTDTVCLQFLETSLDDGGDGVTYLGSVQQANKRIVYDLQNSEIQFGPADCSNEN